MAKKITNIEINKKDILAKTKQSILFKMPKQDQQFWLQKDYVKEKNNKVFLEIKESFLNSMNKNTHKTYEEISGLVLDLKLADVNNDTDADDDDDD